jgi:hypothetical protein
LPPIRGAIVFVTTRRSIIVAAVSSLARGARVHALPAQTLSLVLEDLGFLGCTLRADLLAPHGSVSSPHGE